ncbi:undecaprenyldiphospho-muramoylpentapeptide beta-N-acetylglucosaminyltransferase [Pseudohongiella sp.]|uniref:Glycosyl transferase family 28 C-terminal domain-containing protein n=1 Tax=marine sediment metagenome TaxID=412755 RepID=A0A0F9VMX5_9ZZZZ|nr:undecaprenyldiphospho-muramoylpentapeptide beta-N-acetylglucosaminyltransferase [Pseudohongiella sp.]HDZ10415.1 undecaprenyldiphospho-muramoylpentapeptide beta-N-acetylglucosaminyltransferase [Pseudohongiella sp.]HEA61962.1 undecaprenyldiphospho-muramoylpentapeptide beta-N-acetylglucosaminyltransferase [Pseudohongiella sp.]
MSRRTVLIMAAGTGGHIFPALTIARVLQARDIQVEWLGTPAGMENDVLRDTGIKLNRLNVNGLRGKGKLALLKAPFMLLASIWQSLRLLQALQPCCVLGMGGYVTGPGGVAAWLLRRPLVIHEQNAIAGLSNRLLAPMAARVLEAFPGTFKASSKLVHTGNPVRADIAGLSGRQSTGTDGTGALRLLVLGGSLGAAAINEVVPLAVSGVDSHQGIEVWHQTGRNKHESTQAAYQQSVDATGTDIKRQVEPFIGDMAAAYAWADLVLCRAGASTVAELAAAGLPSILVPYPHAVDDHQSANARWLVDAGAAELMPQSRLNKDGLQQLLEELMTDKKRLQDMAQRAHSLAIADAAERVSDVCLEVCRG